MFIKFSAHGKTDISIEDKVIIIESVGPWNIEYFQLLHNDILTAVEKVGRENYAILFIPIGEAICTHEVINFHINFLRQGNTKALAVNLSLSEVPNTTESICRRAYEKVGLTFDFFNDNEQAKVWLESKIS